MVVGRVPNRVFDVEAVVLQVASSHQILEFHVVYVSPAAAVLLKVGIVLAVEVDTWIFGIRNLDAILVDVVPSYRVNEF